MNYAKLLHDPTFLKAVALSLTFTIASIALQFDGAGLWRRFASITLPQMRPVTLGVLLICFIYTFKVFDLIYITTHGGPVDATLVLLIYVYKLTFDSSVSGTVQQIAAYLSAILDRHAVGYLASHAGIKARPRGMLLPWFDNTLVCIDQMPPHQLGRTPGVALDHASEDTVVFAPHAHRHARVEKHLAHGPPQVVPMQSHRIADQRIAREVVDE